METKMSLTVKDLEATILALIVVYLYWAKVNNLNLPVMPSYRIAILFLGIVGLIMCTLSGSGSANGKINWSSPFIKLGAGLGILSIVVIILGLITGAELAFVVLTGLILFLWLLTTLRHAFGF